MKIKTLYLILSISLLLFSCQQNTENKNRATQGFKKNLFNPFYIDYLFNTPNNFGSFWINKHVKQINISKISIVLKGGSNPENELEKYIYTFDKKGNNNNYKYFFNGKKEEVVNETNFEYTNNELSKINIYKYFGVGNLPPIRVLKKTNGSAFIKSKANGKNDTLFIYPSIEKPKIIIDKIGKFINYLEIFIEVGATKKEVLNQINEVYPYLSDFELADKTITYTKNGLPVESYHLGENWTQLERSQVWEYNKFDQVIQFKEWMHGTLIKDISILYNENSLPKKIIFNRKKYQLIYSN